MGWCYLEGPQFLSGYLTFLKTCSHTASLAVSSWGERGSKGERERGLLPARAPSSRSLTSIYSFRIQQLQCLMYGQLYHYSTSSTFHPSGRKVAGSGDVKWLKPPLLQ